MTLSAEQRADWERDGFFILRGFAGTELTDAMRERIVALARRAHAGDSIAPAYVQQEQRLISGDRQPEEQLSKLFRVHRQEPVFESFARDRRLLALIADLLGPDLDCFLSQFIFKYPGAMGQPWHQDAFYFPFDTDPQIGAWLAISEANANNGPLWVLPGSHAEPVHDVVGDRRPGANFGYVEIIDHDMEGRVPVLMKPGDLLVFHGQLMHCSTDNESEQMRAAMVFHYAIAGTVDGTLERFGFPSPNNDFMPVLRDGKAVEAVSSQRT